MTECKARKETHKTSPKLAKMGQMKPRTLSLRGHCWRAALLAVFRLIVDFVSRGKPVSCRLTATGLHRSRDFGFQKPRSGSLLF
jgi:hypothetical protein